MRHGYGVRTSAPFGKASKFRASKAIRASLTSLKSSEGTGSEIDKREKRVDDTRGGFVLKMNSTEPSGRRRSLGSGNIKKGLLMVSERNDTVAFFYATAEITLTRCILSEMAQFVDLICFASIVQSHKNL